MMVHRATLIAAGIAGATAITIGAFGAHGLEDQLAAAGMDAATIERRLPQFETGARYHLAHALALLTLSVLPLPPGRLCSAITWLIVAGIVLFSGSLYTLVITNTPWLGAITPIGGVCWIAAWSLVAVLGIQARE